MTSLVAIPPAVLFSPAGPAGWGWSRSAMEPASAFDPMLVRTPDRIRNAAASTAKRTAAAFFGSAISRGFTPSDAIDFVIEHADYVAAARAFTQSLAAAPIPTRLIPARERFPRKLWQLSMKLGAMLDRGGGWTNALIVAFGMLESAGPEVGAIQSSMPEEERQSRPLWFLEDRLIPDKIAAGMLASHRSNAALDALDGYLSEKPWQASEIHQLAKIWSESTRAYLVLVASIPEAQVPTKIIPASERFDVAEAIAKQRVLVGGLIAS